MINCLDDSPQANARTLANEWHNDADTYDIHAEDAQTDTAQAYFHIKAATLRDCAQEIIRELG